MESERKVEWESGREGWNVRNASNSASHRLAGPASQQRAWRDEEVLGGDRGISVMRVRRVCVPYRGTVLAAGSTSCFLPCS